MALFKRIFILNNIRENISYLLFSLVGVFSKVTKRDFFNLGLESFESVLETYRLSRQMLGEVLSSCEMMDKDSVDASANIGHKCPIGSHPFYMIVETSGSNQAHDAEKLETFLQTAMERNLVTDGTQTDEPGRIKVINKMYIYVIYIFNSKLILIRIKK